MGKASPDQDDYGYDDEYGISPDMNDETGKHPDGSGIERQLDRSDDLDDADDAFRQQRAKM